MELHTWQRTPPFCSVSNLVGGSHQKPKIGACSFCSRVRFFLGFFRRRGSYVGATLPPAASERPPETDRPTVGSLSMCVISADPDAQEHRLSCDCTALPTTNSPELSRRQEYIYICVSK